MTSGGGDIPRRSNEECSLCATTWQQASRYRVRDRELDRRRRASGWVGIPEVLGAKHGRGPQLDRTIWQTVLTRRYAMFRAEYNGLEGRENHARCAAGSNQNSHWPGP